MMSYSGSSFLVYVTAMHFDSITYFDSLYGVRTDDVDNGDVIFISSEEVV